MGFRADCYIPAKNEIDPDAAFFLQSHEPNPGDDCTGSYRQEKVPMRMKNGHALAYQTV
jgi:hypothetical protein